VDGTPAAGCRRGDQILALGDEAPALVTRPPPRELADLLELLVVV
jgi:hypothetical protein